MLKSALTIAVNEGDICNSRVGITETSSTAATTSDRDEKEND